MVVKMCKSDDKSKNNDVEECCNTHPFPHRQWKELSDKPNSHYKRHIKKKSGSCLFTDDNVSYTFHTHTALVKYIKIILRMKSSCKVHIF